MADPLRYGAVAASSDGIALLVWTPGGQARYVTMTTEQALACIETLASVLRNHAPLTERKKPGDG